MRFVIRHRFSALAAGIVCAVMLMAPAPSWSAGPSPLRDVKVQNWTEDPSLDWIADAVRFYGLWYSDTFTVATGKTVVGEEMFDLGYTLYGGYYLDGDDISLGVTLWKGKTFLDDRHFTGSPEKAAEWLSGLGGFLADYLFPGEENLKITARPTSSTAALKTFLRAGGGDDGAVREALLEEALGEDPAFLEAAWKLGVLRLTGKEYGKALSHFAAYAAARPLHAGAFYNRALALLGLGRSEEALGIVENVALDRGKETATVLMLVTVYEASGLAEEAAAIRAGLPAEVAGSRPTVFTSPYPGGLPASWMAEGPGAETGGVASPLIKVAESGVEMSAEKTAPAAEGEKESSVASKDEALADEAPGEKAAEEKAALRREVEEYRKLTADLQESLQEIQQEAAKVAWEAIEAVNVEEESRKEVTSLKVEKEDLAGKAAAGEEKVKVLQEKLGVRDAELGELTRTVEALKAKESEKQAAGEKAGKLEEDLRTIEGTLEEVEGREQEKAARIVTLLDELERERLRVKDLDGMLTEERARTGSMKTTGEEEVLRLKGELEKLEAKIAALQGEKKKEPAGEEEPGKVAEELRELEEVLEAVEGREQENAERIVALLNEFELERNRAKGLEESLAEERAKTGDLTGAIEKEKQRSEDLVAEVLKERSRAKEFEAGLKELRAGGSASAPPAAGREELEELESGYEKRFASLGKELGRKEKEVAGAASRITELEGGLEELTGKLEKAEAEKAELIAAAAMAADEIAPLPAASAKWDDEEKTEYWEKRTRDLQQTIAELSRRESEMVAEVQIRDELIEELRRKDGGDGPAEAAELRSKAAQLEAKAAGMEAELLEERKRVEELTMSLVGLNLEGGESAAELKKKDELIAGYEKRIAELEAREPDEADLDKRAKKRIAKLEEKLAGEEEKRKAVVGRLEESRKSAEVLGKRIGDLEKELKKAGEESEKAAGKIEKLSAEKDKVGLALEEEKKSRRGKVGDEKAKLEKKALGEREKIEEKHRAEIESLTKKQAAEVEDLVKENAAAAEEAAARHVAELEEQAKAGAAATEELTGKYTVMLEEAEKKHASGIEILVKELAAEREKADRDLAEGARAAAGTVSGLEEKFSESEKKRLEFEERSAELEKQVDELAGKLDGAEKQLKEALAAGKKSEERVADLAAEKEELEKKLSAEKESLEKKLRSENEDLARKLSEERESRGRKIAAEKEKLEKKYSGEREDLEKKHAAAMEKLGKELSGDSEKALGESGKKIASLEEALAEERAGRGEAIEQIGRLEGFLNEETAKREEAVREQEGIADQLKEKISALEKDLSRSGKDEGRSAKRIEYLEGERDRLQEKLDKREEDLSTYYSRVDDLAESVSTLEKDLFRNRREKVNALERVRELEGEKRELSKGVQDRDERVKASGKDIAALEKKLAKLRKSEEKGAAELAKLEKSRKELEEKLESSRKDLEGRLEATRRELEGKLDGQKRELEAERKRASSLEKAAGKRGDESGVLRDSLETMQKSLDLSLQRTADLEKEVEELRALNRKLAEKLKETTLELIELKVH